MLKKYQTQLSNPKNLNELVLGFDRPINRIELHQDEKYKQTNKKHRVKISS